MDFKQKTRLQNDLSFENVHVVGVVCCLLFSIFFSLSSLAIPFPSSTFWPLKSDPNLPDTIHIFGDQQQCSWVTEKLPIYLELASLSLALVLWQSFTSKTTSCLH